MMVYVASSKPLDLIDWVESAPAFHVKELPHYGIAVRAQFPLPYVYNAGSHEGCGCGFLVSEYEEYSAEDLENINANYNGLAEYLTRAHADGAILQLFSCWNGDETAEPAVRESLDAGSPFSDDFVFQEKALYIVE